MTRVLIHASEVLTGAGIREKGGRHVSAEDMGRIPDGAIAYTTRRVGGKEIPDRIEWVGPTAKLPGKFARALKTDLRNRRAVTAGLVDCHTHLVFAGDRAEEFAARCAGESYEQIAARGGGIATTVRATREASVAELERLAIPRLKQAAAFGTRTIEIKSGYGLSFDSEMRVLEVVKRLQKRFPELTLVPTFLGAHAFPKELTREAYLAELTDRMLPEVARRKLAAACDVFVDEGYYTAAEGERILRAAKKLGLAVKLHADELSNTESAALATELGALSADHLLKISERGIRELAHSRTVAVLLPGTAFYLKAAHAPARKLLDAGVRVALATDFNPGTCMCLSLPFIMTIAALYLGMSAAEILAAVTWNGAAALGLEKRKGTIEPGMDADFMIHPFERFEGIYYSLG